MRPARRSCWLWLVLIVGGAGCSAFSPDEPPVPDSLMAEVLLDLHLADARAVLEADVTPAIRDSILARHGLTADRYEEVVAYYVEHPEAYSQLYSRVLDRLNSERLPLERR